MQSLVGSRIRYYNTVTLMSDIVGTIKTFSEFVGQTHGQEYFERVALSLQQILECDFVFIGEFHPATLSINTNAIAVRGQIIPNLSLPFIGTPCESILHNQQCKFPSDVGHKFPNAQVLPNEPIDGFIGIPLLDAKDHVCAVLAVMHPAPLKNEDDILFFLDVIAHRISAELERIRHHDTVETLSSIFHNATEAMLVTDAQQKIVEVNDAFCEMFGYTSEQVLGQTPRILSSGFRPKSFVETFWHSIETNGVWQGEIKNSHASGNVLEQWVSITRVLNSSGEVYRYTAAYTNLTELRKAEAKNLFLANTDPLSGLSSKAIFNAQTQHPGRKWVLIVGIDGLRYLNEAYGFGLCDQLIRKTGYIMRSLIDAECYVGVGPGKYALLFKQEVNLAELASKLRSHFSKNQVSASEVSIFISLSFAGCIGQSDLLRLATTALILSKQQGKPSCVILDQDKMNETTQLRNIFVEANNILHRAFNEDLIIPYYQGVHNNHTGEISHYEALARIHFNDQLLSPHSFIQAAKVSGMLPLLTQHVAVKAFAFMATQSYTFSLNITEFDLNAQYLKGFLLNLCERYSIEPARVVLEVLEEISSSGKSSNVEQLKDLKKAGFSLAIDDFGAEYSNFERILDLEVDMLKIDARYIKDIHNNKKSYEIVKAIVFFTQNSGIACVAEYVHCLEVQKKLVELGVDFSQGYLFSRPESYSEHLSKGSFHIAQNKDVPSVCNIEVKGHIPKSLRFSFKLNQIDSRGVKQVAHCQYCIFDMRNSDYFWMEEEDLMDRARLVGIDKNYQQFTKIAVLTKSCYARKMAQQWVAHVNTEHFIIRCFEDEVQAHNWFSQA